MKATLKHPLISLKIHGIFFKPQVTSLELEQVTFQAPQVTSQGPQETSQAPQVTSKVPK